MSNNIDAARMGASMIAAARSNPSLYRQPAKKAAEVKKPASVVHNTYVTENHNTVVQDSGIGILDIVVADVIADWIMD